MEKGKSSDGGGGSVNGGEADRARNRAGGGTAADTCG